MEKVMSRMKVVGKETTGDGSNRRRAPGRAGRAGAHRGASGRIGAHRGASGRIGAHRWIYM